MYKSILVPIDGSEHSNRAVQIASDLASVHDARLVLLHVITDPGSPEELKRFAETEGLAKTGQVDDLFPRVATPQGHVAAPSAGAAEIDRSAILQELAKRNLMEARNVVTKHNVKSVEVAVAEGDPSERILDCAERENADAIIMGSRGLSGLKGAVFGSVSQKVCHDAGRTCITVT